MELARLEKKQKEAAIKNYRAFLAAHLAYDVVRDRVENARGDLSHVARDALPELEEIVQRFRETSGKRGTSASGESTTAESGAWGHLGHSGDSADARAMHRGTARTTKRWI